MKLLGATGLFDKMNFMGKQKEPFVFLIDAFAEKGIIVPADEACPFLWYQTPKASNMGIPGSIPRLNYWKTEPVSFEYYTSGFDNIMGHIQRGDSFLLNYTQPSLVETNLSLEELFHFSSARYKVYLKDIFTCFSPETFVTIHEDGKISSHPMKGTADASIANADKLLLGNSKEIAEHHTIVDLIRNDLSRVANNVKVEKFRYIETIRTNTVDLLQVSSKVSGQLSGDWQSNIGSVFRELLPAGSVTGAPKIKTVDIIRRDERYSRGWYTGIFGLFDGAGIDSAVLIRYVEQANGKLIFKSGGGITYQSQCRDEYNEMIKKVYVPVA